MKNEFETPDYEKITSVEEADKQIAKTKEDIVRRFRLQEQVKDNKKDIVASYTDQLKHIKEELDHDLGVLSALEDRRKILHVAGGNPEVQAVVTAPPLAPAAAPAPTGKSVVPLPGQLPTTPATNVVPFPQKAS